eukprot:6196721-Pleurochrysis_carterae.AAC.1
MRRVRTRARLARVLAREPRLGLRKNVRDCGNSSSSSRERAWEAGAGLLSPDAAASAISTRSQPRP